MPDTNSIWQFATSGHLVFGVGARLQLREHLRRLGVQRPCVVTDSILIAQNPVSEMLATLEADSLVELAVFEGGEAEPSVSVAEEASAFARKHQADCVIGLGGGSNMDVAKIVATLLRHPGAPADYFGFAAIPGPVVPIVAIPTTAGTGSEVSHSAVLTDHQQCIKVSTLSPYLRPNLAVVDPEMTLSCPPSVTAHSGIDALVHAIEAYTNKDFSQLQPTNAEAKAYEGSYPLTRLLAAEAIRLIGRSLGKAVENPNHLKPGLICLKRRHWLVWHFLTVASASCMLWNTPSAH